MAKLLECSSGAYVVRRWNEVQFPDAPGAEDDIGQPRNGVES